MLRRMTALLDSARGLKWANGGTYVGRLPWFAPLLGSECLAAKFLCHAAREEFEELVAAIETSGELITDGELVVAKLKVVLETVPVAESPEFGPPATRRMYLESPRSFRRRSMPAGRRYDAHAEAQSPAEEFAPDDDADDTEDRPHPDAIHLPPLTIYDPPPNPEVLIHYDPYPSVEVYSRDRRRGLERPSDDASGKEDVVPAP